MYVIRIYSIFNVIMYTTLFTKFWDTEMLKNRNALH